MPSLQRQRPLVKQLPNEKDNEHNDHDKTKTMTGRRRTKTTKTGNVRRKGTKKTCSSRTRKRKRSGRGRRNGRLTVRVANGASTDKKEEARAYPSKRSCKIPRRPLLERLSPFIRRGGHADRNGRTETDHRRRTQDKHECLGHKRTPTRRGRQRK
ncbi:hypothetical protein RRG08_044584 [Elysia crispata]|uniref:Uncharacterized protein n=1 Tax=Elysia crispata TaxID=231223 RepID=A0AAE1DLU6_9GAST|nr:hypothetical protein RRG08_044584 [Elysia crispata]